MHDKDVAARCGDRSDEVREILLAVLVVDADPALDRHRHSNAPLHPLDALCHQPRFGHQAGAKASLLHAGRRTSDIEVDLVVAEVRPDRCGLRELARIGAAKLKRDGMLDRIEA